MTRNTAYEQSYKNGFEAGKQVAVAALRKLKELPEEMRVRAIAAVNAEQTEDFSTENQWISVDERLPEIVDNYCSDEVIVCTSDGIIGIDHLDMTALGGYVFAAERPTPFGDSEIKITHWMPLPEVPKAGDENG